MAVADITNESEFDAKISGSGDALVVVDYSTTWCGPCKVIAPKFDELSDAYPDSVFLKVRTFICQIFVKCYCIIILRLQDSRRLHLAVQFILGMTRDSRYCSRWQN